MTHRRSKFWNFFISFMPGAGQMYQGFLKRGTSLMSMFFAEIFIRPYFSVKIRIFNFIKMCIAECNFIRHFVGKKIIYPVFACRKRK